MRVFNIPVLCGTFLAYFATTSASLVPFPSVPIPLSNYFDNQAASIDGTTGNFNNDGSTYAAEYLPTGPWFFGGVTVSLFIVSWIRGVLIYIRVSLSMTSPLPGASVMIIWSLRDRLWNFRTQPMSMNFI